MVLLLCFACVVFMFQKCLAGYIFITFQKCLSYVYLVLFLVYLTSGLFKFYWCCIAYLYSADL